MPDRPGVRSTDREEGGRGIGPRKALPLPVLLLTAGAILLRLLLLLGRGDYLAFDEGWYLLLARSIFEGEGYSLVGLPHVTLSPLFPLLAGAVGDAFGSWVWGGRIVAAVAAGLLVLPAWAVFRRLAPPRTAFVTAAIVAVMPSLAPFVVPFWIGADLWVGAEPLLHLFLFTGVAFWLKASAPDRPADPAGDDPRRSPSGRARYLAWALSGGAFGLGFLARPEAIITWGLLGLAGLFLAARRRSVSTLIGCVVMGVALLVVAAPYWMYLHDVTGRWTLTGRGISPAASVTRVAGGTGGGSAGTIERMLWADDTRYQEFLYSLDPSGLRLQADYWGVDTREGEGGSPAGAEPPPNAEEQPRDGAPTSVEAGPGPPVRARASPAVPDASPPAMALYVRALGIILPLLLWPLVVLGAVQPRSRSVLRRELPVTAALVGTSLAVALVVAVDARTQLFLAPLLAFYVARGFSLLEETLRGRWSDASLRPGFVEGILAVVTVVWLLGVDGRRLYLSLALGSPHHIVAEQNRAVAEELDGLLGDRGGPIASWHPAMAVWADRDWRVLPFSDLPGIVRYLDHAGAEAMVLSAYYPPDFAVEDLGTRYLVLPIPETGGELRPWEVSLVRGDSIRALGRLEPPAADSGSGAGP